MSRWRAAASVSAAAAMLLWPAVLNGYPIVFSDTGGLMEMGFLPDMGWDKPFIYGPLLAVTSLGLSLWGAAIAQALAVSWVLWLLVREFTGARAVPVHLALCLALALASAAPWFAGLLMPDIFAPLVALCTWLLVFARHPGRVARAGVAVLGIVAVAVHLAHLPLAVACLGVAWLVRWRVVWRAAVPLAGALLVLLGANLVGNGVLSLSPYGSIFLLARLVADGPAAREIERACPHPGWRVCEWQGRLPTDSDAFLWSPEGPVWGNDRGPVAFAPEASQIVRQTLLAEPLGVARAMVLNAWRQLALVRVGDVLGPEHLDVTVLPRLQAFLSAAEVARYQTGLQASGRLPPVAEPLAPLHLALLALGAAGTLAVLALHRRDRGLTGLCAVVLVALLANAFATGALSGPHHRYQARIAWLVLLPPLMALAARAPARQEPQADRRATSAGAIRTRAS